jgi:hypothetical protein
VNGLARQRNTPHKEHTLTKVEKKNFSSLTVVELGAEVHLTLKRSYCHFHNDETLIEAALGP